MDAEIPSGLAPRFRLMMLRCFGSTLAVSWTSIFFDDGPNRGLLSVTPLPRCGTSSLKIEEPPVYSREPDSWGTIVGRALQNQGSRQLATAVRIQC
jgi:hypothetical protein